MNTVIHTIDTSKVNTCAADGGTCLNPGNPRAVTISNNGTRADDSDEFAYVTLFFGTPTPDMTQEISDASRTGAVIEISLSTFAITRVFTLNPIANIAGFVDAHGNPVGCSPNQLSSITLNQNPANSNDLELYVPNICASAKGPTGGEVNVFNVVSVIDLGTGLEDTSATGTSVVSSLIVAQAPDAGSPPTLLMGDPVGLDFKLINQEPSPVGYLLSKASNAIQRMTYNTSPPGIVLGKPTGFAQIPLATTAGTPDDADSESSPPTMPSSPSPTT